MAEIRTRIYGSLMNTNGTLVTSGKLYITLPQEFVNVEGNRVAPYVYEYTITGSLDFYLYATTNSVGGTIYAAPSPASVSYIIELDPTPTDTTVIRSRKSGYFKLTTTIPHISDTPGSNQTTFGSLTSSTTVANYNYAALGDTRFLTQAQRDALTNGSNADAYHIHVNVSNLAVTDNGGLNIAYAAGVVEKRDIGAGTLTSYSISASTLAMTDSTTNYVYVDSTDGVVKKKGTAFTSADISLATVVTSGGDITSVTDKRALLGAFGLTTPVSVASGGTGTATGSITGTSALTFTAGGSNQNVTLTPSGSGYTLLNGNVGIGTTSPGELLHVVGNIRTSGGTQAAPRVIGDNFASNSGVTIQAGNAGSITGSISVRGNYNGADIIGGYIDFVTAAAERMRITEGGNVGIGTMAPGNKLDISGSVGSDGSVRIGNTNTNSGGYADLFLFNDGGSYFGYQMAGSAVTGTSWGVARAGMSKIVSSGTSILIGTEAVSPIIFGINSVEKVRIDTNGNVGIGTTAPGEKLSVVGKGLFGASSNVRLQSTGADVDRPTSGGLVSPLGNLALNAGDDSGTAGLTTGIYYYQGAVGWRSALEVANTASGFGNLSLMKNGGNVGIGTTGPASLTEIQGGLTTVGAVLTLGSKETSTVVNDVLGRINFYAPLDAAGTDAILVAGSIAAVAEGSFSATSNATSLIFQTGASEVATTKMTISSAGLVTVASASYGGTPYSGTKLLIGGDSGTSALTIGAPANQASSIYFADPDSGIIGRIDYTHTDNKMAIVTNGSEAIGITSTGLVTIASGLTVTSGGATITAGNLGVGVAASANASGIFRGTQVGNVSIGVKSAITAQATGNNQTFYGFLTSDNLDLSNGGVYTGAVYNGLGIVNPGLVSGAPEYLRGISITALSNGTAENAAIYVSGPTGSGANYGIFIASAPSGGTSNVGLYNAGSTTLTARLTATTITATLDTASTGTALVLEATSNIIRPLTSAERYKENIRRDWQTDTEAFFALSPILFDYKNGGARDVLSFSADQSMSLPHLVNLNSDGLPESLREHAFIAYLFNNAKADHARIAELERKLKLLLEVSKCEDS